MILDNRIYNTYVLDLLKTSFLKDIYKSSAGHVFFILIKSPNPFFLLLYKTSIITLRSLLVIELMNTD